MGKLKFLYYAVSYFYRHCCALLVVESESELS